MTSTDSVIPTARSSLQRERLLDAMIDGAARDGYAATTVTRTAAHAGLSTASFHEHFSDKQDCFLAALHDTQRRVLADIRHAVAASEPAHARDRTIGVLIELADTEPARARVIMNETMAGGPRALDARDQGIARIASVIEHADSRLGRDARTPDVSCRILLGAIYRLLARRLRRRESPAAGLHAELLAWVDSYSQPAAEHRWRTLEPLPLPGRPQRAPATALRAPTPTPPGSSRRARTVNQRERILFAAAQAAQANGYTASTAAEIAGIAGVAEHEFAALFDSKQDAYMAVHDLGFRRAMAATAGGFFSRGSWPERTWQAARAFAEFFQDNPTIAHIGFVEPYAVGPGAIHRVESLLDAFTIFLGERERLRRHGGEAARVAVEAIAATNFELGYSQTRRGQASQIGGLVPHAIFVALAPFIGARDANVFIERQLAASVSEEPPRRPEDGPESAGS